MSKEIPFYGQRNFLLFMVFYAGCVNLTASHVGRCEEYVNSGNLMVLIDFHNR